MDHRAEQDVDLFLLSKDQFSVVTANAFHRVATVNCPTSFSELAALFFGSVGAKDDILRGDSQLLQETHPELMGRPDIQHFGDSDAELRATFKSRRDGTLLFEPSRQHSGRHLS